MGARTGLLTALIAGALAWLPGPAVADEKGADIQLWPVVTINHGWGENFGGHFTVRGRFDENIQQAKDVLLRSYFSWRGFKGLTFDLGYDYVHSFTSSSEHRAWQAGQHHFKWRDFSLGNRIRLDERFVEDVDGVVVRFRYRFRATHPLGSSKWYGAISDEVFTNVNDRGEGPISGFEQNRLRFAIGGDLLKRLNVEAGYEYQYVERRDSIPSNAHTFVVEFSLDTGNEPIFGWAPR